jgi:hypothetical protein
MPGARETICLSSMMTRLNYLMEAPSDCGPEDANFSAFVEATSIIRGRDAMEEFLAGGLWPLREKFGLKVEAKESPCQKLFCRCHKLPLLLGHKSMELLLRHRL